jgi:hypothetical protein
MKAVIEAMCRKEMGSYKASRVLIICLPPHSSPKMQPLDKPFMPPPKKKSLYCQEIEKWLRSNAGRFVTVYQIGKLRNRYVGKLQQARQRLMAAGRRAFCLVA